MSTRSVIVCQECGAENRASAKFCGGCGEPILTKIVCAACGTSNTATQRFCDACGEHLAGDEASGPQRPPALPRTLGGGRYEVLKFLGEGGKKKVYLANDSRLGREVAVAVFKVEGVDHSGSLRARHEAEAMARLGDHPNVVTVFDMGEEDGQLYLVSQYMSGGDLAGLLNQAPERRLAVEEVLRIGADVARGLEHAHANGVVHRDLKPHNVWLAPDGTAKIGDFGLALAAGRTRLTVEGAMVGTVAYMPPEQCLGQPADARSDVYSLGALLYELLCGAPPFVGDDAAVVIAQHVSTAPVGPTWHRPDVPGALEQVVLKMLAKGPAERPQAAAEVREAIEAISAVGADAQALGVDEGSALDRLTEGTFLGREAEVSELRAAADGAVAGRGRVAFVAGEAGVGKTRLAAEIAIYAELRGAQVLWGRCYEGEGAPAYWPWIQVIRAYVHGHDTDSLVSELGSGGSDIAQIVSEIRERLPDLPEPPALDPEQARFRLFDSITTFLVNASATQPLAIFLDDLHLADRPSLMLLQFFARELAAARVLVLGTYRDEELDRGHLLNDMHASLSRERNYGRTRLRGLSEPHVQALLEGTLRQPLESDSELALAAAVFTESDGNPYFIEEIVRHLVESGALYERDGRWVTDARDVGELGIPEGIREAVGQRLSRLPDDCRELLVIAAVIGREFRLDTLGRVTKLDAATALARLGPAIEGAIVRPIADEADRYGFTHVAARDALYGELPEARRVELHKATGEVLEELYEDRIESHLGELAHHFAAAAAADGEAEKAADYAWWAGEHAAVLYAYEEAVAHYARALALFEKMPDEPARRCELLLVLGDVTWRAGDAGGAKRIFLEAAAIADELMLAQQYARAALGYGQGPGGFSVTDRADPQLIELLRSALQRLPEGDSALRVRLLARLAVELYYLDDPVEPDELSGAAVEMAERVGDAKIVLLALYSRQWAIMGPDRVEDNVAAGEELVRLARALGDRDTEFQGHRLRVIALIQLGDMRGVDRAIDSCERLADELHQPGYRHQAAIFRVMRALMQGRFKEAARLAQTAFAIGERVDSEVALVTFGAHSFITKWAEGGLEELADGARMFAEQYGQAWPSAFIWLLTEIDALDEARERFAALAEGGFATLRHGADWLTALAALSVASIAIGDQRAAEKLYELLEPYADNLTPVLAGSLCLGSNHAFLGFTAKAAGRLDVAAGHFERALEVNDEAGAHFLAARIHYEYARTLIERDLSGDGERVTELVEAGLDGARKLGMPLEVQRLVALKLKRQQVGDIDVQTSIDSVVRSVELAPPDLRPAAAPDGTVTIMFSDIEDSTVLTEQLGDQRWLALLRHHNEIVRRKLSEHRGYEVKAQGDGFMIAFASARHAIYCAVAIQQELARQREQSTAEPLRVRIGLHTGEVIRDQEDFFGKNVVLAARIAAQARGDEILVSSLLRELVVSAGEFEFEGPREVELKGISGSHRLYGIPWAQASEPSVLTTGP